MKVQGIWTERVPMTLDHDNGPSVEEMLDSLLEMIDFSMEYDTKYYVRDDLLYGQTVNGTPFYEWLYGTTVPQWRDLKKELSKKIAKSISLSEESQRDLMLSLNGSNVFFIDQKEQQPDRVWTKEDYLHAKQHFLTRSGGRAAFLADMPECFTHIHFTRSAFQSFQNALQNDFQDIKDEIVAHLGKLDAYFQGFVSLRTSNADNRTLCAAFKEFSGIDCSPQADRSHVQTLYHTFYNQTAKQNEQLCCELHTKFRTFNRDRENQDRIYFHPGRDGIEGGKIIVVHIGKHQ